jgi:hypothetical protein
MIIASTPTTRRLLSITAYFSRLAGFTAIDGRH